MNKILKQRIAAASEHFASLCPRVSVADVTTFRRDAFQEGAMFALDNQWISVEEALPDESEEVLCLMKSNDAVVSGFIFMENGKCKVATRGNFEFEDYCDYETTAWMPLPEFKKGGQE